MTETILYRIFDKSDELLYVGITGNLTRRMYHHKSVQPWWEQVHRIKTETYPTRDEAFEAESGIIRSEKPLHNHCRIAESYAERRVRFERATTERVDRYSEVCAKLGEIIDSMTPEEWEAEVEREAARWAKFNGQ